MSESPAVKVILITVQRLGWKFALVCACAGADIASRHSQSTDEAYTLQGQIRHMDGSRHLV